MFSGSPLLESVMSIPRASAITIKKTATVKPIVKAVASVLPFLTMMFLKLYFIGSAILFSAPQGFGNRQTRNAISRIDHADESHQNRQAEGDRECFFGRNERQEIRNNKTQIH